MQTTSTREIPVSQPQPSAIQQRLIQLALPVPAATPYYPITETIVSSPDQPQDGDILDPASDHADTLETEDTSPLDSDENVSEPVIVIPETTDQDTCEDDIEILENIVHEPKAVEVLTIDSDSDTDVIYEDTVKKDIPKSTAFVSMLTRSKNPQVKAEEDVVDLLDSDDDEVTFTGEISKSGTGLSLPEDEDEVKRESSYYASARLRGTGNIPHDFWWNSNILSFDSRGRDAHDHDINRETSHSGTDEQLSWAVRPRPRLMCRSNSNPKPALYTSDSFYRVLNPKNGESVSESQAELKRPRLS
jgi:hypothetical protein